MHEQTRERPRISACSGQEISKSYPHLWLARRYGLSYSAVLCFAEYCHEIRGYWPDWGRREVVRQLTLPHVVSLTCEIMRLRAATIGENVASVQGSPKT